MDIHLSEPVAYVGMALVAFVCAFNSLCYLLAYLQDSKQESKQEAFDN